MGATIGSIVAKLMLNIDNFSSNLSKIQSEIEQTGKKLDGLSKLGSGMTSVGKTLTTSLTLPIVGVGVAATKVATDFEYNMSQVQAISGATGEQFESLEDLAINLGGSTKYSASEVAVAMTEMAKAGWTTEDILSGMAGVLDAAAASGEELGSVSTIVADAITGFGLAASDSSRVADLLTQAANSGTIGIGDLGESFKYIAPVASSLGFSIEDATTAIAAMSTAGIKGSQAGTSLKNMLTNLVKPTDAMQEAMDELGISVTNQDGSMKSLDDIVATLRTSFAGLTEAEKAKYAATLAGKEGMSGMLAILNMTKEEYDGIAQSMDNAGGVAGETAAVMQDNLKSSLEQLGGAFESLGIRIGQQLIPVIRTIAEKVAAFAEKLAGMSEEQVQAAIKIAALVAAVGPLIAIVGKLIETFVAAKKIFTAVQTALPLLKTAIAGVSAPVLAVVAVVAVLVAAFVNLWNTNEEFRTKITEIWTSIVDIFKNFFQGITDRINALGFNFKDFAEVLRALWQGLCDFLAPLFIGVFNNIKIAIETVLNVILGLVDFWIAIFKGDWQGAWDAVKGIFESVWNGIVAWFRNALDTLTGVFDVVLGWFGTSWEECWDGIKNVWSKVTKFFSDIWTGIKNTFSSVGSFFKSAFTTAWTAIKNVFGNFGSFFSNLWDTIKNTFVNLGTKIGSAIGDAVKAGINGVIGMIENTINGFIGLINGAISVINAIPGVNIGKIKELSFPRLAKGGIVEKPTLAEIGEDGKEAVVPLENNLGWLDKVASMLANSLGHTLSQMFAPMLNTMGELQTAVAGAYGSVASGTVTTTGDSVDAVRNAQSGGTIHIEKIEVRDDDDIEELTQGLYNHNDKSLRAMGRRNL